MNSLETISQILNKKTPKRYSLASLIKTDRSNIELLLSMPSLKSTLELNPIDNSLNINLGISHSSPLLKLNVLKHLPAFAFDSNIIINSVALFKTPVCIDG